MQNPHCLEPEPETKQRHWVGFGDQRRCPPCQKWSHRNGGGKRPDGSWVTERPSDEVLRLRREKDGLDGCQNPHRGLAEPDNPSRSWVGPGSLRRCPACARWSRVHGGGRTPDSIWVTDRPKSEVLKGAKRAAGQKSSGAAPATNR